MNINAHYIETQNFPKKNDNRPREWQKRGPIFNETNFKK